MICISFSEFLVGIKERVSWVAETSHGSGGTMTTGGRIPGYDCTIEPNFSKGYQEVLSAGADERTIETLVGGPEDLKFTMSFVVSDWRFLKYLFTLSEAGAVGAYTHTCTVNNSFLSFKLEWAKRHTTAVVLTLTGCVIKKCEIVFQKATGEGKEGHLLAVCECVAKTVTPGASVSTLTNDELSAAPFSYKDVKLTLSGSEVVEVNSGKLIIDQGIDENDSRYCSSTLDVAMGEPIPKIFRCVLNANINVKDNTFLANWDSGVKLTGVNKIEFIRGTNDDFDFAFGNLFVITGVSPTNLEGVTNVPLVAWDTGTIGTIISTDAIQTY